jgi:hypothetical protein
MCGGSDREAAPFRALPAVTAGALLARRGRAVAGNGTTRHANSIAADVNPAVAATAISDRRGIERLWRFTVRCLP